MGTTNAKARKDKRREDTQQLPKQNDPVVCPRCKSTEIEVIKKTAVLIKYRCKGRKFDELCGKVFLVNKPKEEQPKTCLNCASLETKKVGQNRYYCELCETYFMG